MASVKVDKRAIVHAGRMLSSGNGAKIFTSGLLFGLISVSLLFSGQLRAPKAPKNGVASDWKSVGSDINAALGKRGR